MPQQKLTFSEWQMKLVSLTEKLRSFIEESPVPAQAKISDWGHIIKINVARKFEAKVSLAWVSSSGDEFYLIPAIEVVEADVLGEYEGLPGLMFFELMGIARKFLFGIEVHSVPKA